MNKIFTCNQPVINIYRKPDIKSEVISQILYGEKFYAKNKIKNFLQGYSVHDRYQGYAKFNFFTISNKKKLIELNQKKHSCILNQIQKVKLQKNYYLIQKLLLPKNRVNL